MAGDARIPRLVAVAILAVGLILGARHFMQLARARPIAEPAWEGGAGLPPAPATPSGHWKEGASLLAGGQADAAARAFLAGWRDSPGEPAYLWAAAESWGMAGRCDSALWAIDEALKLSRSHTPASRERERRCLLEEAFASAGRGELENAQRGFERLRTGGLVDSTGLLLEGYLAALRGQAEAAEDALGRAVAAHPGLEQAYPVLLQLAIRRGDAAAGRYWLDRFERISPSASEIPGFRAQVDALQQESASSRSYSTTHLRVRCPGEACPPSLEQSVAAEAERSWSAIALELGASPTRPAQIVIEDDGSRRLGTAAWAGAIFDGQVRIPRSAALDPEALRPILRHELTHAFLAELSLGRVPLWFNEGLAQWFEGKRPEGAASAATAAWLDSLPERSTFMDLDESSAEQAYGYSLEVVAEIIRLNGFSGLRRYLDRLAQGTPQGDAFRAVFGCDFETFSSRVRARAR